MNEKHDGGAAFPGGAPIVNVPPGHYIEVPKPHAGMSMRDYFAAQIAMGLAGNPVYVANVSGFLKGNGTADVLAEGRLVMAREAYDLADAMLKEREKSGVGEG